jgi:hypothetical protein
LKNFFVSILILSILSFQLSELLVYTAFKINQDYIAKNLCVEKDVVGSTCKGCCHLTKKVNEQQEQKKDLPPIQTEKPYINFCKQSGEFSLSVNRSKSLLRTPNQNEYHYLVHQTIFHPPRAMV